MRVDYKDESGKRAQKKLVGDDYDHLEKILGKLSHFYLNYSLFTPILKLILIFS